MPNFSNRSRERLETVHPDLKRIAQGVINHHDFTVIEGHRDMARQTQAVLDGVTTKTWPNSKHNQLPSQAMDLAPYYPEVPGGGIDWRTDTDLFKAFQAGKLVEARIILENIKRWYAFANFVRGYGAAKDVILRWGGDWNGDFRYHDHKLVDLPHFELLTDKDLPRRNA